MSCEGRKTCRGCGMHTWIDKFGCSLPGCPQYAAWINEATIQALDELDDTLASKVRLLADLTPEELDELGGVAESDARVAKIVDQIIEQDKDLRPRQIKIRASGDYETAEFGCPHCGTELVAPWQPCPKCGRND